MTEVQQLPEYINVSPESLGKDTPVEIRVVKDNDSLAKQMAEDMFEEILQAKERNLPVTMIVPVGPVDQYPFFAELINSQRVDLRDAGFIQMDEYLDDDNRPVSIE